MNKKRNEIKSSGQISIYQYSASQPYLSGIGPDWLCCITIVRIRQAVQNIWQNELIPSASLKSSYFNFYSRLTLPGDLKPKEIKWLSVWCRQFTVNFGDVFFPDDMEKEDIYDEIFDNEVKPKIDWQDLDSESENSSATLNLSFVAGLMTSIVVYFF